MNKAVLASAIWAATTGFALAEVKLSAEARSGILSVPGSARLLFTSKLRINFNLSVPTDGDLAFGGFFASSDINGTSSGTPGSLFVEGSFGRLSVGNVDGATSAAIGQVRGVGLVSGDDQNDISYIANGGGGFQTASFGNTSDPTALLRLDAQDLTLYASVTQPEGTKGQNAYALAAKQTFGKIAYAVGYEHETTPSADISHYVLGATATFGKLTTKAIYGQVRSDAVARTTAQWAISAAYTAKDLTLIAYFADDAGLGSATSHARAFGLGASYRLADGVTFVGGLYHNQTRGQSGLDVGLLLNF